MGEIELDSGGQPHAAGRLSSTSPAATLARLETFLASVPLGVMFLDRSLRVERANAALGDVFGSPLSDPAGRFLDDVLPQVADILRPVLRRVIDSGRGVSEFEFSGTVPNAGGRPRHFLSAIFPIAGAGVGVIVRDITDRQDEREREGQRLRHREALYALTAALVEADTPQQVVRAVVRHATLAFEASGTVVARSTADGRHVELLDAEGMPADVAHEWRRFPLTAPVPLAYVARTGEPLFLESARDWESHFPELAKLAGDVGHPANAIVPLTIEHNPIGALGIAFSSARTFDDEERALAQTVARQCALALERARLLEAERAARAAAVAANQVKTKFLATMSHELRTPLNAIAGYAELLELEIHGPLTADQRDDLARIRRNLQHLLGLVGSVLSLLKLEAGHIEYAIADVSLESVLQFVGEATAPQLAAKHLRGAQSDCRGLVVRADAAKTRQILLNLLSNAIKFTDDGGSIAIDCTADDDRVHVHVRDTGLGIAADQLERVFDPFVQVDQGLGRPPEGTGLGLAISRELARGMGGELTASSEVGVGSTFTLVLPRVTNGDSVA